MLIICIFDSMKALLQVLHTGLKLNVAVCAERVTYTCFNILLYDADKVASVRAIAMLAHAANAESSAFSH